MFVSATRLCFSIVLLYAALPAGALASESIETTIISKVTTLLRTSHALSQDSSLATKIRNNIAVSYKTGSVAQSVEDSFTDPAGFASVLDKHWGLAAIAKPSSVSEAINRILHSYSLEYRVAIHCQNEAVALPETLAEAAEQILTIAQLSQGYAQAATTKRQAKYLTAKSEEVLEVLTAQPHASDLSRSHRRLLRKYFSSLNKADMESILCAGSVWLGLIDEQWLEQIETLLSAHPLASSETIEIIETPLGVIVFSGLADSVFLGSDVLFVADLGGDDFYGIEGRRAFSGAPQLIVDFSGNDAYQATAAGSLGGAIGSSAAIVDFEGNDRYLGPAISLGSSLLGVAAVVDFSGNDFFESSELAQGASLFGIGLLLDFAGDDEYRLGALGQGLGMTNGLGQLIDIAGSDRYFAAGGLPTNYGTPGLFDAWAQGVGLGPRDIAPGGIGLLVDGQGQDNYDSGSFAQGGGYFLGLGVFHDSSEAVDEYFGSRYNFAWGAHGGIGRFTDHGGDDSYRTRHIVAAGLAWDRSLSFFQDRSGNDKYELGDFSLGAAGFASVAVFLDQEGADSYTNVIPADAFDSPPNLGVFIDIGIEANDFSPQPFTQTCQSTNQESFVFLVQDPSLSFTNCE